MISLFSSIFRCTLNAIPQTSGLLNKARLPLGILIHPFKDLSVSFRFLCIVLWLIIFCCCLWFIFFVCWWWHFVFHIQNPLLNKLEYKWPLFYSLHFAFQFICTIKFLNVLGFQKDFITLLTEYSNMSMLYCPDLHADYLYIVRVNVENCMFLCWML